MCRRVLLFASAVLPLAAADNRRAGLAFVSPLLAAADSRRVALGFAAPPVSAADSHRAGLAFAAPPPRAADSGRAGFTFATPPVSAADNRRAVFDLFTGMASALSEGNPIAFMQPFDRSMPGVQELRAYVTALIAQAEVLSSIEILSDEGDDAHRTVELDWFLQIRDREETGPVVRRRETVKCRLERRGKKWVVVSLAPLAFFAPPRP